MADNNNLNNDAYSMFVETVTSQQMTQEEILRSIDKSLREIAKDANNPFPIYGSQSAFNDRRNASRQRGRFVRNDYDDEVDYRWDVSSMRRRGQRADRFFDELTEEFERQMWQSLTGDPISNILGEAVRDFAKEIGSDMGSLAEDLGHMLAEKVAEEVKKSPFGRELSDELTNLKKNLTNGIEGGLSGLADSINRGDGIGDMLRSIGQGSGLADTFKGVTTAFKAKDIAGVGSALLDLGSAAVSANWALLAVGAATIVIDKLSEAIQPVIESFGKLKDSILNSANRDHDAAQKRLQNEKERIKKDNEAYLRAPFEILKKSADEVYAAWDRIVTLVGQTQGYDKENIQTLWSNYAKRLQQEGLSAVVSSVDIMGGLEQVLKAGLSGPVAEEFAYIATKLNNAIPTEDFFSYASTYASIAANAIKMGKSQSEAIEEANEQLEEFASNLLYSSRELAGGFSTGLTHAEGLFEAANNIAVAAHTNNAGDISGVLTSVAAIVGAIAPDLTSSIVTKITDAATGGNSSELTALRSLAGTGASNTAFLQALAKNPQEVFTTMFGNLAQMQNMYGSSNYMELAESLATTFGMTIDEMSRIDFGYLAQAVSSMDLNNASLNENVALLASGSTTLTADQLRMQQINQYMIDEGLSYVLDNEVARTIQEHMWDEQIANMLMENEYSVDLVGAGKEFLQSLVFAVDNIFTMLNPFGWMRKVESLNATLEEGLALNEDIKAMLEAGNLGKSNPATLYNLTTHGTNLNLTKSYLELLGGHSAYSLVQGKHRAAQALLGGLTGAVANGSAQMVAGDIVKSIMSESVMASRKLSSSNASSQYSWSTIGKSITQSLFTTGNKALYNSGSAYPELNMSAQGQITARAAQTMQAYLDTMQSFVDEGKSFEEWKASASEYGIEDLGTALQDYNLSEVEAKGKYQEMEAVKAAMYEHERDMKEEQFWDDMIKWCEEDFPAYQEQVYIYYEDIIEKEDSLITNTDIIIGELQASNKQLKEFYNQWVDYFVNHTAYHRDTLNAHEIEAIRTAEEGEIGDSVFALAQALTDNMVNLQDPQVQANALLSQILLVTEAIFQIENNTTTVSLPQSLAALGLGVTSVENQY